MTATTSQYGRRIEPDDFVGYKCETRFSNGQLVDFDERRKQVQKFEMGSPQYIAHKRRAFETMCAGEVAWFVLSDEFTNHVYHNPKNKSKFHEMEKIDQFVWIKLTVDNIKRRPVFVDKKSIQGRIDYYEKSRVIAKELMEEAGSVQVEVPDDELAQAANQKMRDLIYKNAQEVYSKCRGELDGIPRKMKDLMTVEQ